MALKCDAKLAEKLTCCLENDNRKFSTVHTNVSKLGPSLGPFMQSRKYMSLKLTGELCAMTSKNDAKIEKELTCQLKVDIRKLANFNPSTRKSQQFTPSWAAFDKSN